jgi:ferredoxin-NADP reductase
MQLDPAFWWYVTRASAVVAWILLVASVLLGILLSTRLLKPRDNPGWLLDLHRWLSGLSVTFVGLHMLSLYLDNYAHFTVPDLLIPFHSGYQAVASLGRWPVAIGVMCAYAMVAVQFTSLLMRVLPRRLWKAIHYLSYATVLAVSFHAGWTGTDTRSWVYRITALVLIMLTTAALIVRILVPQSARTLAAAVEGRRPNQNSGQRTAMVVERRFAAAEGIVGLELRRADGQSVPPWVPGSHLTLHLPNGLSRQYSLCGDPATRGYQIAVLQAAASRGGSSWIHEHAVVGTQLEVSGPLNHFELEPSGEYLFVAGGIGITPIKAMVDALPARRQWRLLYAGRSRKSMAFVHELTATYGDRVYVHADDEQGGLPDLDTFLASADAQVYVCGPEPLLSAVEQRVPIERLHFERFAAVKRTQEEPEIGFEVTLARRGVRFVVAPGERLLDALNQHGAAVVSSCGEGVCGTCEVRVLAGEPLHRDSLSTDEDKDEIRVMYPCVSGSRSATLTLDL